MNYHERYFLFPAKFALQYLYQYSEAKVEKFFQIVVQSYR